MANVAYVVDASIHLKMIHSPRATIIITFVNALTGAKTPTIAVTHYDGMCMRVLLGPLANLFKYIIGMDELHCKERLPYQPVTSYVTVNFLKPPLTFHVYFHDAVSRRSWFLCNTAVDVLAHFGVDSPVGLSAVRNTMFTAATLWDGWLRYQLWNCDQVGPMAMYRKIVDNIDNDIMTVPRVRRRNVIHEMHEPFGVDIYFVLCEDNYLNLRLRQPEGEFRVAAGELKDELRDLVMELHH